LPLHRVAPLLGNGDLFLVGSLFDICHSSLLSRRIIPPLHQNLGGLAMFSRVDLKTACRAAVATGLALLRKKPAARGAGKVSHMGSPNLKVIGADGALIERRGQCGASHTPGAVGNGGSWCDQSSIR
jgi:hypothetical protein